VERKLFSTLGRFDYCVYEIKQPVRGRLREENPSYFVIHRIPSVRHEEGTGDCGFPNIQSNRKESLGPSKGR
jgi:hypothetical protein